MCYEGGTGRVALLVGEEWRVHPDGRRHVHPGLGLERIVCAALGGSLWYVTEVDVHCWSGDAVASSLPLASLGSADLLDEHVPKMAGVIDGGRSLLLATVSGVSVSVLGDHSEITLGDHSGRDHGG